MKVVCYPADQFGCGYHRVIWPAQELQRAGHDVEIVMPQDRAMLVNQNRVTGEIESVDVPEGTDVVVLQRVTHRMIVQVIRFLTARKIAVVVDVDDDLTCIHPANPAAKLMGLTWTSGNAVSSRRPPVDALHSWQYLTDAVKYATMVQTATPELAKVYGTHRPSRVVRNYLSRQYFDESIQRADNDSIAWPASIHSHPNDPQVMGDSVRRLIAEGHDFYVVSDEQDVTKAFGLRVNPRFHGPAHLFDWPRAIAGIGVGIVPLANTKFNRSKSWLKGLELSAVGVPWVASPRAEYRELTALGAGQLAGKPSEWYAQLKALATDPTLRQELSEAGRATAKSLRLEDHAWRFWEAWTDAERIARR